MPVGPVMVELAPVGPIGPVAELASRVVCKWLRVAPLKYTLKLFVFVNTPYSLTRIEYVKSGRVISGTYKE